MTLEIYDRPRLHEDWIDSHALGIVKALQKAGFTTYLVGGCVRDLLVGIHPKDFDIATQALPQQVKKIIYMAFIIGKRFRLVLVKRDTSQYEIATFRREMTPEDIESELPQGDNFFGTPEQDALRRDFTINALFYDPIRHQLIDFAGGEKDIEDRIVRMIGEPKVRLAEDSIRILRALRLSHLIGFSIEPTLREAMLEGAAHLSKSVLPRRREEILKILRLKEPAQALLECHDLNILRYVLPSLDTVFADLPARELFLTNFAILEEIAGDKTKPANCIAWLAFALLETSQEWKARNPDSALPEWYCSADSEKLNEFLKNEIGVFRYEQSQIARAWQLIPLLRRSDEFRRRGQRRLFAVLRSEGFEMGLRLARVLYLISPHHFSFWYQEWIDNYDDVQTEQKPRRPRRPRKRSRQPQGDLTAQHDSTTTSPANSPGE